MENLELIPRSGFRLQSPVSAQSFRSLTSMQEIWIASSACTFSFGLAHMVLGICGVHPQKRVVSLTFYLLSFSPSVCLCAYFNFLNTQFLRSFFFGHSKHIFVYFTLLFLYNWLKNKEPETMVNVEQSRRLSVFILSSQDKHYFNNI